MLSMSRKQGEVIVINDEIRITIVEIRGNKVRIGIDAPKGVSIFREELWLANQKKKEEGAP